MSGKGLIVLLFDLAPKFGVGPEVFAMATCVFAVSFVGASLVTRFSRA